MTATAGTTRASNPNRRHPRGGRSRPRPTAASGAPRHARDLPREYRVAHVYRTLGGGLVAEYDPD